MASHDDTFMSDSLHSTDSIQQFFPAAMVQSDDSESDVKSLIECHFALEVQNNALMKLLHDTGTLESERDETAHPQAARSLGDVSIESADEQVYDQLQRHSLPTSRLLWPPSDHYTSAKSLSSSSPIGTDAMRSGFTTIKQHEDSDTRARNTPQPPNTDHIPAWKTEADSPFWDDTIIAQLRANSNKTPKKKSKKGKQKGNPRTSNNFQKANIKNKDGKQKGIQKRSDTLQKSKIRKRDGKLKELQKTRDDSQKAKIERKDKSKRVVKGKKAETKS